MTNGHYIVWLSSYRSIVINIFCHYIVINIFCGLGFSYAFNCLRKYLAEETVNEVRRMNLTVDGMGAVFDVPSRAVDEFTAGKAVCYSCELCRWFSLYWGLDFLCKAVHV